MFIPFGLAPDEPEDGISYEDVLTDYMQSIAYRYGTLFYRDRVASYLAEGLQVFAGGESDIERVKDIGKIVKWVNMYRKRLRAA
jgi:hypothetical protein